MVLLWLLLLVLVQRLLISKMEATADDQTRKHTGERGNNYEKVRWRKACVDCEEKTDNAMW